MVLETLPQKIDFLKKLADIASPSQDPEGVERVQILLKSLLETLDFRCELISNPQSPGTSGPLLVATRRSGAAPFVTFVTHSDTLPFAPEDPRPRFAWLESEDRIVGQGVLDDKASQVVALAGLESFLEGMKTAQEAPHYSLRFVASPSEELGSPGFHEIFRSFGEDSAFALGFEPSLSDGSIVESRRGNRWYEIDIQGQEAHAGRSPERGVNAAQELAEKIHHLKKLHQPRRNITVNVGSLQAGRDLFNVVCGQAHAKIDTRFSDLRARDRLHARFVKVLEQSYLGPNVLGQRPQTQWRIVDDCPPMGKSWKARRYVRQYCKILSRHEGHAVHAKASGGAADICYMSRAGLVCLDGLGALGGNMHRADEYAVASSLQTRAEALSEFLFYLDALKSG